MRNLERALKAAADPTRTRILKILEPGPLCVCQVQAVLGLAPSTLSRHLFVLKAAGLVEARRDGKWIHYRLASDGRDADAQAVLAMLRGVLGRDPETRVDRRRLRAVRAIPVEKMCAAPPRAGRPAARRPRRARTGGPGA